MLKMKIEIINKGENFLYTNTEDLSYMEILKIIKQWIKENDRN